VEHRFRLFEKRMARKRGKYKRDDEIGGWKKLCND
jgi:hypothetical protein